MNKKRVVITGIGVIAANGVGVDNFWEACIHGVSGVSWIEHFDASQLNSKIAAVVKNFNPADYIPINVVRKTDRFVHLGLAAALMAVGDAQISLDLIDRERAGVIIGSGLGGMMFHEEQILQGYEKGVHRLNPMCVPKITPNAISGQIAIHLKMYGPNITISTACSSGTHAIGQAFRMIQNDEIDMAISGGAEAPLTEFNFGAYDAMQVLSSRNDIPQKASRPFDKTTAPTSKRVVHFFGSRKRSLREQPRRTSHSPGSDHSQKQLCQSQPTRVRYPGSADEHLSYVKTTRLRSPGFAYPSLEKLFD